LKGGNLLVGVETFFQKNAYHPYATYGNMECGKTGQIQDFNTSINKQLQNRDRKANENISSELNTQQTLRKYTKSVTKT